jgi:hypothetical protein
MRPVAATCLGTATTLGAQRAEASRLDAGIAANLKERGHGP